MFYKSNNVSVVGASTWNTAKVTDTRQMFFGSSKVEFNMTDWNTKIIRRMSSMFLDSTDLAIGDVSTWETDALENMESMFTNASWFSENLCWNLTSVDPETMIGMFCGSNGSFDCSCVPIDKLSSVTVNCDSSSLEQQCRPVVITPSPTPVTTRDNASIRLPLRSLQETTSLHLPLQSPQETTLLRLPLRSLPETRNRLLLLMALALVPFLFIISLLLLCSCSSELMQKRRGLCSATFVFVSGTHNE